MIDHCPFCGEAVLCTYCNDYLSPEQRAVGCEDCGEDLCEGCAVSVEGDLLCQSCADDRESEGE